MKLWLIMGVCCLCGVPSALASHMPPHASTVQTQNPSATAGQVNFSPLFVQLSDAIGEVKKGDSQSAQVYLAKIEQQLTQTGTSSQLGQISLEALHVAQNNPTLDNLSAFASALYDWQKAQNPVDYTAKRKTFSKKVLPAFDELHGAVEAFIIAQNEANLTHLRTVYSQFNAVWAANERVVRSTSMGHYGAIETHMAMVRVAFERQPPNIDALKSHTQQLQQQLTSFVQGDIMNSTAQAGQPVTLVEGIGLLQSALNDFEKNQHNAGQAKIGEFIGAWPMFEAEVSTRDGALYAQVESELPTIMARSDTEKLRQLLVKLNQINPMATYSAWDAMAILLREGLEALLIVTALLSAVTATGQKRGEKTIIAGVIAGLLASIAGAMVLQLVLPSLTSGTSREALEGVVGIVAVVMMVGVGMWLHSKSSVRLWNSFIQKQMHVALSTGATVGLFGVSFLSVFREGAETILFYAGILSNIHRSDFWAGIGMALAVLTLVAFVLYKTSLKLPMALLFKILTAMIYFLGFKMLGVSIFTLQLVGKLPHNVLDLPTFAWAGFYPSLQGLIAQLIYIAVIVTAVMWVQHKERVQFGATTKP